MEKKQRLAITRAILKDAPILLFDEITSALDAQSESFIQKYLQQVKNKKTIIMIAHRLSTIKDADKIIVLNKGIIEEIGTHQTLLDKNGLYSKMVKLQLLNY